MLKMRFFVSGGAAYKRIGLVYFFPLPEFVNDTQNPFVADLYFDEYTIPSLRDFVNGNKEEMSL